MYACMYVCIYVYVYIYIYIYARSLVRTVLGGPKQGCLRGDWTHTLGGSRSLLSPPPLAHPSLTEAPSSGIPERGGRIKRLDQLASLPPFIRGPTETGGWCSWLDQYHFGSRLLYHFPRPSDFDPPSTSRSHIPGKCTEQCRLL